MAFTQIEGCLNSCPISAMVQENDSMKALKPGNFLIDRPIWRLYPNRSHIFTPHFILRCWQLEPKAFTSFSAVMATEISRWFKKCHDCTWNLTMSDVILLHEDNTLPMKRSIADITEVHPGKDGIGLVILGPWLQRLLLECIQDQSQRLCSYYPILLLLRLTLALIFLLLILVCFCIPVKDILSSVCNVNYS